MHRRLSVVLAAFALALVFASAAVGKTIQGQFIVVLKPGVDTRAQARSAGADVLHTYRWTFNGYAARLSDAGLAKVRADSRVLFVSPDRTVHALAQTLPTGVDRIDGDASSTKAGDGAESVAVPVAVIDTGIDRTHPDLNVVGGTNCSTGRSYNDGNGHGTHVAGTIGAKDDGIGVVGMAPGTPLYAVRVLNNNGSGSWSSVICGIDWVTGKADVIRVANMSLGGSGSDDADCGNSNGDSLHKAICRSVAAGVTYVVAAGNSNVNFNGFVPAAYNEVLTVSAVADFNGQPGGGAAATCRSDVDDTAADFSNWTTPTSPDADHTIASPGVCIYSTWKGGAYNTISGTSMASPHVAGTAALCIATAACSGAPAQIVQKLRTDAALRLVSSPSYGFAGVEGRYYGDLVYAGGY